jgi:hypothetical protein
LPFILWGNPFAFDFGTAAEFDLKRIKIFGFVIFVIGVSAIVVGLILRANWVLDEFPEIYQ